MDLDDLKAALHTLEGRLDATLTLATRARADRALDRTRSALRPLLVGLWVEVGLAALAVLWLGAFLAAHVGQARFAVPAAALHVGALLLIAADARQLVGLARIDYAGPVVRIQRELAALRALRARVTRGALLIGTTLWTFPLIVGLEAAAGFDLVAAFGLPWVAANVAFGLAVSGAAVWASGRFGARLRRSSLARRLADDLAGRSLARALGHVEEAARFERGGR